MCVSIFLPAAPGRRRGPRSRPSDEAAGRPRRGPNGRASRLPARRRSSSRPRVLPAALPALPARRARRSHPGRAPPQPGPCWAQLCRARPAPPRRRAPGRILRRRAGRAARSGWAPGGCGRLCPRPLFKAASGPPALGRPGGGTSGRRALGPRVRARGSAGRHGARARAEPTRGERRPRRGRPGRTRCSPRLRALAPRAPPRARDGTSLRAGTAGVVLETERRPAAG